MAISYASNAVLSKVRSMYGYRLTDKNYSDLLSCASVSEVASYLKNKTHYKDVLSTLNERDVHRGQLEVLLRKKLFYDFESIGRYELSIGEDFFKYVISRMEIQEIMHFLVFFISSKPEDYIYALPTFFTKHTNVDIMSFNKVRDYDDFLKTLEKSEYFDILKKFKPVSKKDANTAFNQKIDITIIEKELYTNLYGKVFSIISKRLKGSAENELTEMFASFIDLSNMIKIYRLKKYYDADEEYIKQCLIPFGDLSKSMLNELINAENSDRVVELMKDTGIYKKYANNLDYNHIYEIPYMFEFYRCRHYIRYSVNSSVVMMSYIFLAENEISNITNIIEGVRYELPQEEIKKILIW